MLHVLMERFPLVFGVGLVLLHVALDLLQVRNAAMHLLRQLLDVVDAVVSHHGAAPTKKGHYVQELATWGEVATMEEIATMEHASASSDGCLPNTLVAADEGRGA